MKPFDLYRDPLHSRMIIEASAGTGKTFAITRLLIRMLLESNVTIDRILIVTFTRMAARELRERIHELLHRLLIVTQETEPGQADPELIELLGFCPPGESAAEKLGRALLNIDDVQVCTIHSFCQSILSEEALRAGQPFDLETGEGSEILVDAARDFWRNFIASESNSQSGCYYIDLVTETIRSPVTLLSEVRALVNRTDSVVEHESLVKPHKVIQQVIDCVSQISRTWISDKEAIIAQLKACDVKGFGTKTIDKIIRDFDDFSTGNRRRKKSPAKLGMLTRPYLHNESNLKKNGTVVPDHHFFDLCGRLESLRKSESDVIIPFLIEAADKILDRADKTCRQQSFLSFDMLLSRLKEALSRPETGSGLAAEIRERYVCTLIDEFQDTDPLQYDIFNLIYPEKDDSSSLIMIGDPKQAIYGFRGADIYAYLKARRSVPDSCRYTLRKNYRSSGPFVRSVNTLFSFSETPFINEEISYHTIESGIPSHSQGLVYSVPGSNEKDGDTPLKIHFHSGLHTKSDIKKVIYNDLCYHISKLIRKGLAGDVHIGDRPLNAGDIAVIVHSHRDAEAIRNDLERHDIGAVIYSRESVYTSREATMMDRVLDAVVHPFDRKAVCRALSCGLFGSTLPDIWKIMNNGESWQSLTSRLQHLQQTWEERGICTVIRKLLVEDGGLEHIAGIKGDRRTVTNLLHLAELMSNHELESSCDPHSLLRRLRLQIESPPATDSQKMRLDDDRRLVKILTIHNSKGLEFPVVFCPTLWDSMVRNKPELVTQYHDPARNNEHIIHVGTESSEKKIPAHRHSVLEACGEEVRKAYVAITRARYECHIFWSASKGSHLSGFGAMLLGKERVESIIDKSESISESGGLTDQTFRAALNKMSNSPQSCITLLPVEPDRQIPTGDTRGKKSVQEPICRRITLPSVLTPSRIMYSYSSLSGSETTAEWTPDYDQNSSRDLLDRIDDNTAPEGDSVIHFPKGAKAGTFIHKLFEDPRFSFDRPELPDQYLRKELERFGFKQEWAPVLNKMLADVSHADYRDLRLNRVETDQCLREMAFQFPTSHLSVNSLLTAIRPDNTDPTTVNRGKGLLSGFIDLVARQDDRYYIIDYKSNWLGDSLSDYRIDKLSTEIREAQYDLQYHLYTLALTKYLNRRLPNFDYKRHFGGVYYLFIRGMKRHSDNGIFFHKPDLDVLVNLERSIHRYE